MTLSKAEKLEIKRIAEKYNVSTEEVMNIIDSTYEFIRNKIAEIDFKDNLTREEFEKLKTNFNIPCIGKLCALYLPYKRINKI